MRLILRVGKELDYTFENFDLSQNRRNFDHLSINITPFYEVTGNKRRNY